MDIALTLTNFSAIDRETAKYMIALRNEPTIAENTRRAALTPPEAALPLLPSGTAAEIRTSYETVFVAIAQSAHASYITQAAENNATARQIRELLKTSPTQAQLNAMLAAGTS